MKRAINTNVLNGFITQAVSHNKYLEESEMWKKKRQLESTDSKSHSRSSTKKPRDDSRDKTEPQTSKDSKPKPTEIDDLQVLLALYKDAKNEKVERWDHSGFAELYPEHDAKPLKSNLKSNNSRDSDSNDSIASSHKKKKSKSSKHKKSRSKHKKKHKKKKDS